MKTRGSEPNHMTFPPGFLWGAATSAYQVEVDYETQRRTIKASERWWGEVAAAGGLDVSKIPTPA